MANYKRVISYMYAYRNQLKGNNVGFARIETRGNECKITLHVRVVNMKDQEIGSYMYCWYNGEMHAVYLGDIHISNGVGELVVKTDVDNVMNSRYRFTEMSGILLYVSDAQYVATEWDGKAVLFDALKIDTVKPDRNDEERSKLTESRPVYRNTETAFEEKREPESIPTEAKSASRETQEEAKIETAVAVMVPEEEQQEEKELSAADMEESLDEMIENEVAKEEQETVSQTETVELQEEPQEELSSESVPEEAAAPGNEEMSSSFPLSQEKMEHLDKQAQELFGTMLLNTLFPPENSTENKKEEDMEMQQAPVSEPVEEPVMMTQQEEEPVMMTQQEEEKEEPVSVMGQETKEPEAVPEESMEEIEQASVQEEKEGSGEEIQASGSISINPKSAIECFTAFRSCESDTEYQEIQEEIQTLSQEIKHLEHISEEWKIKEARLREMEEAKAEAENSKSGIEKRIRSEYHIDGIQSELTAAELKRALTERIFNKYPQIQPFDDASVERCVRIEPQDLGILPMENWILANNSFLLHGYYSYRHLVFVMENEDGKERYLLGVPGVNHSRESFMANMFGFTIFKQLTASENETGEFGYWCQEIML